MVTRAQRALLKKRADRTHDRYVQRAYGLNEGEYAALLLAQDNRCAICGNRPYRRRLAVDHSHITGQVRGLLCLSCNHEVLARLEGDREKLQRLIVYAQRILDTEFPEVPSEPEKVVPGRTERRVSFNDQG